MAPGLRNLSIWIEEILHACSDDVVRCQGKNAELRMLYNCGSWLLAMCLLVVFVFDGPQRSAIKQNKTVYKGEHWMVAEIKMCDAFGFSYHQVCFHPPVFHRLTCPKLFATCTTPQAAGKAEAELALLNTLKIIDGVLTEDSDAIVFGATSLIQK